MDDPHPDLARLREQLEREDAAYADVLAAVDRLAGYALPAERVPEQADRMRRLNDSWTNPAAPEPVGVGGRLRRRAWDALAPALERHAEFHSVLVQVLNAHVEESARVDAHLRELAAALVRYLQRVLPVMDARDRMATGLATTRAELILEAFDRRQESLARRIEGLAALRDRIETLSEEVRALRATLAAAAPAPDTAVRAERAAADAVYTAFENRYRGTPDELRAKLSGYVEAFRGLDPVADLGCGRGEFLELLRDAGIAARGVDGNLAAVEACRARGLDVAHGDLIDWLSGTGEGELGGVFAAQVAEHLPPGALLAALRQSHRVLRPGGVLLLETVNPRSVVGLLEVFLRDLTHQKPLHPDTLSFLTAAAGFHDVRVEMRAPVEPAGRLQPVPAQGLPSAVARTLNENVERLNGLLYGPQEYVLIARR